MTSVGDFRDSPYVYIVLTTFIGPDEELDDWAEYYEQVHFPRIRQVPGVKSADRYVSSRDGRRWVAIYGLSNPDVFTTPEYLALPGIGPWRSKVREWKRLILRPITVDGFEARADLVGGTGD